MRILFLTIFLSVLIVFGIANSIDALTISPPLYELSGERGDVLLQKIRVLNETGRDQTYYTSMANFRAKGEGGEPNWISEPEGLASWLQIESGPINLKSGEEREITFSVNIPEKGDPGGHYAAIFFGSQPPESVTGGAAVGIGAKLGSLIVLRVAGDIRETGILKEFSINKKLFNYLPADFIIRFENTGNVHFKPKGTIDIENTIGIVSAEVSVNDIGGNVLPQSVRKFESSWKKEGVITPEGNFFQKFWTNLKNEKNNFALGRYTANLNVKYGQDSKKFQAKIAFWVFPWRLMLSAIIILAILFFGVRKGVRTYNKWIIRRSRNHES